VDVHRQTSFESGPTCCASCATERRAPFDQVTGPAIRLLVNRFYAKVRKDPEAVHRRLEGITPRLFERWLTLFAETATSLQLVLFYQPEYYRPTSAP